MEGGKKDHEADHHKNKRSFLERFLMRRPSRGDLQAKNILPKEQDDSVPKKSMLSQFRTLRKFTLRRERSATIPFPEDRNGVGEGQRSKAVSLGEQLNATQATDPGDSPEEKEPPRIQRSMTMFDTPTTNKKRDVSPPPTYRSVVDIKPPLCFNQQPEDGDNDNEVALRDTESTSTNSLLYDW